MNSQELTRLAVAAGFDEDRVGIIRAKDGKDAVLVSRNPGALARLETIIPALMSVEDRFHSWVIRDSELDIPSSGGETFSVIKNVNGFFTIDEESRSQEVAVSACAYLTDTVKGGDLMGGENEIYVVSDVTAEHLNGVLCNEANEAGFIAYGRNGRPFHTRRVCSVHRW